MNHILLIALLLPLSLLPAKEIISDPTIKVTLKRSGMSMTIVASDNLIGFAKDAGDLTDPNNFMPMTDSEADAWKSVIAAVRESENPAAEVVISGKNIQIGDDDYARIVKLIANTIPMKKSGSANESIASWPAYAEIVSAQQGDAPEPATGGDPASRTPSAPTR